MISVAIMIKRTRRGTAAAFSATFVLPATAPLLSQWPVRTCDMFESTVVAITTIAFQRVLAHMQVWTLLAIATVAFVIISADLFWGQRRAKPLPSSTKTGALSTYSRF